MEIFEVIDIIERWHNRSNRVTRNCLHLLNLLADSLGNYRLNGLSLHQGLHKMGSCNQSTGCSGRKRLLADLGTTGIFINDTVVVSSTGADNFTSIGDAIAFAPNNSMPQDGYFVIYVRGGYYEEYVVVPKYKTNIMLVGDGINRTVITGNHSVVDGWTTYNSSTFSK